MQAGARRGAVMFTIQTKQRHSAETVLRVTRLLDEAVQEGLIVHWDEGSQFVRAAYRGAGGDIHKKWNVKIYKASFRDGWLSHSIVCVDFHTLNLLLNREQTVPPELPVITIDDSGWGFPLCGVMVGATDGERVLTDVVPVEYFRGPVFARKDYLFDYAERGVGLVAKLGGDVSKHRIEICTGYVNTELKRMLRKHGFHVRVVEVTGLLQDNLERLFKEHVAETLQEDCYYDPKDMDKGSIHGVYAKVVELGRLRYPHLLKTGWKALGGGMR